MGTDDQKFGGAPSRLAYLARSAGALCLVAFAVFPIILGGIRPTVPLPELGYVERMKSLFNFVYVSKSDLSIHQAIFVTGLSILVLDLIYELLLARLRKARRNDEP